MEHSVSAGGVVLNEKGQILLINEGGEFWGLPKGRQEHGESLIETARREIHEEAGIDDAILLAELGQYERHPYDSGHEDKTELKHITLFVFTAKGIPNGAPNTENNQIRWVEIDKAVHLLTHPTDGAFLTGKAGDIKKIFENSRNEQNL